MQAMHDLCASLILFLALLLMSLFPRASFARAAALMAASITTVSGGVPLPFHASPAINSIVASNSSALRTQTTTRQRRRSSFRLADLCLSRSGFDMSPPKNQRLARKLKRSKCASGDKRAFA
jgi:hypothetical protein